MGRFANCHPPSFTSLTSPGDLLYPCTIPCHGVRNLSNQINKLGRSHVLGRRNDMSYVEACALHQLFLPVWKLMSSVSKSVFSRYSYFLNDSDFKSLNKEILMISWAEMIKHFIESYKLIKKKLKTKSSKSQNNFRAI